MAGSLSLIRLLESDLRGLSVAGRSLLVADDKMRCVHELRRETSAEQAQREARCRESIDVAGGDGGHADDWVPMEQDWVTWVARNIQPKSKIISVETVMIVILLK